MLCKGTASLSLLQDNPDLMWGMVQGLNEHEKMGILPHKKAISSPHPTGKLEEVLQFIVPKLTG